MGLLDEAVDEIAGDPELRRAWYLMIILFGALAVAVSAAYGYITKTYAGQVLLNELQQLKEVVEYTNSSNVPFVTLFAVIFANNSLKDVLDYALLVTLVFPFLFLALNGALVGFVAQYALPLHGTAVAIFYYLVPHGVIEIPAFSLVAASFVLIRRGVGVMYEKAFALLALSVLMLLVAAAVESGITPLVGSLVSHLAGG